MPWMLVLIDLIGVRALIGGEVDVICTCTPNVCEHGNEDDVDEVDVPVGRVGVVDHNSVDYGVQCQHSKYQNPVAVRYE